MLAVFPREKNSVGKQESCKGASAFVNSSG
jgi:hypothetical protein